MSESGRTASARPVTTSGLVLLVGDLVAQVADSARDAGHGVRLGVDGCIPDDGTRLADAVSAHLAGQGRPVARVRQADFALPRSQRLELGAREPLALWERWYDDGALRREVLDPLGAGGAMTWLATLRDPHTDRSTRAPRQVAHPGTIVVLDGRFLLRPELTPGFDVVVHLQTVPATQARRIEDPAERERALASWQRYRRDVAPEHAAHLVVRYDHPDRPAVLAGSAR